MTDDQLYAAGAAAVEGWPPLPEPTLNRLAAILAPLAEETAADPASVAPVERGEAA